MQFTNQKVLKKACLQLFVFHFREKLWHFFEFNFKKCIDHAKSALKVKVFLKKENP